MPSIQDTCTALAAALTALPGAGLTVRVDQPASLRAGDGWVNVTRVEPGQTFTTFDATFTVVIALGADVRTANVRARTLPPVILSAVTTGEFRPSGVYVETAELPAGDVSPGTMYALILNLTLEVDS